MTLLLERVTPEAVETLSIQATAYRHQDPLLFQALRALAAGPGAEVH